MGEVRGSIAFFATYRPLEALDIFSRPVGSTSKQDEVGMTDGKYSSYNGRVIPPSALKTILKRPKLRQLAPEANEADVDSGLLTGLVFVSERDDALETLHIALHFKDKDPGVKVFSLADVFDTFNGVRMEDSGSIASDHFVYVSTMEDPQDRRQPWTVVYKTNLTTGVTDRLTLSYHADLSPAVSPSGDKIAVASFQGRGGWHGEIEDLQTNIYVTNLVKPFNRMLVVENGGWPTWGSDSVIFFHRMVKISDKISKWVVFRADISKCLTSGNPCSPSDITRVTGEDIDAMTPAAISDTKVAVATIRKRVGVADEREEASEYRHIEIFDLKDGSKSTEITRKTRAMSDHYNPFVIDGGKRVGYHRSNCDLLTIYDDETPNQFHKLKSPNSDVGLVRVSGVFPSFSSDGSKLAFVDNEFRTVWIVEKEKPPRMIYQDSEMDVFFAPVWNKSKEADVLYISKGPSFNAEADLDICALFKASEIEDGDGVPFTLTKPGSNNAFPSTSPDGKRLVFRSTRVDEKGKRNKNLYIMENAEKGEYEGGKVTRLTEGDWTDTHCHWSPSNNWIVFSSTRDMPPGAPDGLLDKGHFGVYLVQADKKDVVVRVISSGIDFAGHVNHPFFSPDGKSITVTSDLAAVSVDPISLPYFLHSVRPYGDIFTVDIDQSDINKNKDLKFTRITHGRYENSTPCWTMMSIQDLDQTWNKFLKKSNPPKCPYADCEGAETWRMTGHLRLPNRCC